MLQTVLIFINTAHAQCQILVHTAILEIGTSWKLYVDSHIKIFDICVLYILGVHTRTIASSSAIKKCQLSNPSIGLTSSVPEFW